MPHRIIHPSAYELARANGFPTGAYPASRVFKGNDSGTTTGAFAIAANTLFAVRVRVRARVTVAALCGWLNTTAAGAYRLGAYGLLSTGAPGALIVEAATGDSSSATDANLLKAVTPNFTRNLGEDFFIALVCNAGAAACEWAACLSSEFPSESGASTVVRALPSATRAAGWKIAHTYGALPDPFGSASEMVIGTDVCPVLGFKTAA